MIMITANNNISQAIASPVRQTKARVELYDGSTLVNAFEYTNALKEFTITKAGNEKFFGFGVCAKLSLKLIDKDRRLSITTANTLDVAFGVDNEYVYCHPLFYVSEVRRDELTNELSITAYDCLYNANKLTAKDVKIEAPYTIEKYLHAAAAALGMPLRIVGNIPELSLFYENGANLAGTETLRSVLDGIAEVTGSIYYQDNNWCLTFRRVERSGQPVLHINKDNYFSLDSKTNRRLTAITHTTELGDNYTAKLPQSGTTQYFRENPWLNMRNDVNTILNGLLNALGNLTINQFDCSWRGNYLAEIGDKIELTTKDNEVVYSYLFNTTVQYNGFLSEKTEWSYSNDGETVTNSTNITDALNNTFARVDKVANEIVLVASEMDENLNTKMAEMKITTDAIAQSVIDTEEKLESQFIETATSIRGEVKDVSNSLNGALELTATSLRSDISDLSRQVNTSITQTADSIRSEVAAQGEVISAIQQDLNGISLEYNSTNGTASITIGDVTVSNLVDGEYVEEAIAGITLTGYVTFNDLAQSGSTTINGSNITTGTIDADRINLTGAITWSDLSSGVKNTINSAGGDENPDYIKSTYIDSAEIRSPTIKGGVIEASRFVSDAGSYADSGWTSIDGQQIQLISNGLKHIVTISYDIAGRPLPKMVFGDGNTSGVDKGMIKKYSTGMWIGDSDGEGSATPSGTGLFVNFNENKIYKYINGTATAL